MCSEVTTSGLLHLNGLEQTLEVACTKALMVVALDHLEEQGWSIFDRLSENLQEVTFVVVVNEDLKLLKGGDVLFDLNTGMLQTLSKALVICVGDG